MRILTTLFLLFIALQTQAESLAYQQAKREAGNGNYSQAHAIFLNAAKQGDAWSQFGLGVIYLNGQGVAADVTSSTQWFQKAATQGLSFAQINMGNAYLHGRGVEQDLTKAAFWWQQAAEQGNTIAQNNMGTLLYFEYATQGSKRLGRAWLQMAADQGYKAAYTQLAQISDSNSTDNDSIWQLEPELSEIKLLTTPSHHFSINLFTAKKPSSITRFLHRHNLIDKVSIYRFLQDNALFYGILYGDYPNKKTTEETLANMRPELRNNNPWPISFNYIQNNIHTIHAQQLEQETELIQDTLVAESTAPTPVKATSPAASEKLSKQAPSQLEGAANLHKPLPDIHVTADSNRESDITKTSTPNISTGDDVSPPIVSATHTDEVTPTQSASIPSSNRNNNNSTWQSELKLSEAKLLATPSHYFGISLFTAKKPSSVTRFLHRHDLTDKVSVYRFSRTNSVLYSILYGSYPNKETAQKALDNMAPALRKNGPWLIALSSIQDKIRSLQTQQPKQEAELIQGLSAGRNTPTSIEVTSHTTDDATANISEPPSAIQQNSKHADIQQQMHEVQAADTSLNPHNTKVAKRTTNSIRLVEVKPAVARIREQPSLQARIITRVKKGMQLQLIKREKEWFQVRLKGGKTGWGHKSILSLLKPSVTVDMDTTETSTPGIPVKMNAPTPIEITPHTDNNHFPERTSSRLNNTADPAKQISNTQQQDRKVQAVDTDVNLHNTKVSKRKRGNIRWVKVTPAVARVREQPSLQARIVTNVKKGVQLQLIKQEGEWFQIHLEGEETGWGHKSVLAVLNARVTADIDTAGASTPGISAKSNTSTPIKITRHTDEATQAQLAPVNSLNRENKNPIWQSELELGEAQLLAMPSDYFGISLFTARKPSSVTRFLQQHDLADKVNIYRFLRDNSLFYSILYGSYSSRETARWGLINMHPELRKNGPWPVALSSVQEKIHTLYAQQQKQQIGFSQKTPAKGNTPPPSEIATHADKRPTLDTAQNPAQAVLTTTLNWAEAWSNKDVDAYLGFYHADFKPTHGASLSSWQKQRQQRLTKPSFIKINISDPKVILLDDNKANIIFLQAYTSNTYSDKIKKTLQMKNSAGSWAIIKEIALEEEHK